MPVEADTYSATPLYDPHLSLRILEDQFANLKSRSEYIELWPTRLIVFFSSSIFHPRTRRFRGLAVILPRCGVSRDFFLSVFRIDNLTPVGFVAWWSV